MKINLRCQSNTTKVNCCASEDLQRLWLGWFKKPTFSQTEKLMAATNFSDYLGLKHYKKAKKIKHFIHLALAYWPQSFVTYRSI